VSYISGHAAEVAAVASDKADFMLSGMLKDSPGYRAMLLPMVYFLTSGMETWLDRKQKFE
jgi:hypothetical protein